MKQETLNWLVPVGATAIVAIWMLVLVLSLPA